ncbi:DUF4132 domain-containing protein [Actinokineospora bangkokensis]|uniref:WGR domain-containing protein n=1 Tax=Actinokineospora bangkokensis TaxID=1193682 RepID=A0A1Q9LGU0_9PSEU|nr:DUF4132 domain-containing protein [Actinokineospora bangkokensis]OLR91230.1 hypothetical protein BJP25_26510 [Actinokineospora bangkokensis]
MRRLEYVGGGSEKFWEGGLTSGGLVVSVRWGRLGTTGQAKDKEFATQAAATAHLDKLVGEKLRKGYSEVGAPVAVGQSTPDEAAAPPAGGDQTPAAEPAEPTQAPEPLVAAGPAVAAGQDVAEWPDEDVWQPHTSVARYAVPRRGTATSPRKLTPGATAAATELVELRRSALVATLADPRTHPELRAAAHAHLGGSPHPLGAAVVLAVCTGSARWSDESKYVVFADHWLAEWGPAFATEAVLALTAIAHNATHREPGTFVDRVDVQANWRWSGEGLAERIRYALATAPDADHAAAVEAAGRWRTSDSRRALAAYLLPTEDDWRREALAAQASVQGTFLRLLAQAAQDLAELDQVRPRVSVWMLTYSPRMLPTLVHTHGVELVPALLEWLADASTDAERAVLGHLATFPGDEAFSALLERAPKSKNAPSAVQEALRRFPCRGARLLAEAIAGKRDPGVLGTLLTAHVLARPDVVERVEVSPQARSVLDGIVTTSAERVPDADPADLPPVLADPPWLRPRSRTRAQVVAGLEPRGGRGIAWAEGERDRWAREPREEGAFERGDWDAEYRSAFSPTARYGNWKQLPLLVQGPVDRSLAVLRRWRPDDGWYFDGWGRPLVARFELDALDALLHLAGAQPQAAVDLLQPFTGPEVSALMAGWVGRLKSVRSRAMAYFARHGAAALRPLVPVLVGKAGKDRTAAELVARQVAARDGDEAVLAVAAEYGQEAEAAVKAVLATDPLEVLPAKLPAVEDWANPGLLPQVLLADRRSALPLSAAGHLITVFALCKPGDPYPGLAQVKEHVDAASLARFGWQLFRYWLTTGAPSKQSWALTVLGDIGDDEVVRGLAPLIRAWPGEGGHQRAVTGLDVLAEIGSDVALMHLNGIANKVKFKGLRGRAQEKMLEVAEGLGLSTEQLADRLVPDLGLDETGSMVLDYGPRRFTVGFDEQLKPFVRDEDGTPRKVLPKPGAKDDPALAPHAYQLFSGLKKDVKAVAQEQVRRLERAMVVGRRWPAEEFTQFFAGHPLLWHLVRRLVWGTYDRAGALTGSFRLAEDRTLADVEDDTFTLPEDASVGVAHPLHLGDALGAWSELFADYEILQPFPQLGRPVHELTDEERAARSLARFEGAVVPVGRVLGLVHRGWERGTPMDGGVEGWVSKPLSDGRALVIDLDPGIAVGMVDMWPELTLRHVWLADESTYYWGRDQVKHTFSGIDAVVASEFLADLLMLTAQ